MKLFENIFAFLFLLLMLIYSCNSAPGSQLDTSLKGNALVTFKVENPINSYLKFKSYAVDELVYLDNEDSLTHVFKNIEPGYFMFSAKQLINEIH